MVLTREVYGLMYMIMETNIKVADYICYCNQDSALLPRPITNEEKNKMIDMVKGRCGLLTHRIRNNTNNDLQDYYESILTREVNEYFMQLSGDSNPRALPRILLSYTLLPEIIKYETAVELLNNIKDGNRVDKQFFDEITIDTFLVKKTKEYMEKYKFSEIQAMTIAFMGLTICGEHIDELILTGKDKFNQEYETFADKYINIVFSNLKRIIGNEPEEDKAYTLKK